jgi:hypothetical protein
MLSEVEFPYSSKSKQKHWTGRGLSWWWWGGLLDNTFHPTAGGPCGKGKVLTNLPQWRVLLFFLKKNFGSSVQSGTGHQGITVQWAPFQIPREKYPLQGERTSAGTGDSKAGMEKEKTSGNC